MKPLLFISLLLPLFLHAGGAAELDTDRDGMPDDWELAFGLEPLDPNDAPADPDNDGFPNLDEYRAGTDPTDAPSRLQLAITRLGPSVYVEARNVTGITYRLEYKNLLTAPAWNHFATVTTMGRVVSFTFPISRPSQYYRILAARSTNMPFAASVNITGYVVFTAAPGTNHFLNPLLSTDHRVSSLIYYPPPDGTLVVNDKSESAYYCPEFYDHGWDNPNLVLAPGRNFTFVNPATKPFRFWFIGELLQPAMATTSGGSRTAIRVIGASAANYAMQSSSNLTVWQWLQTNVGPSGFTVDATTNAFDHYFRALYLP